jgi:hypothetical protein
MTVIGTLSGSWFVTQNWPVVVWPGVAVTGSVVGSHETVTPLLGLITTLPCGVDTTVEVGPDCGVEAPLVRAGEATAPAPANSPVTRSKIAILRFMTPS